jgi:hypothetical protein
MFHLILIRYAYKDIQVLHKRVEIITFCAVVNNYCIGPKLRGI